MVVTTSYELGIGKATDPLGSPATSYYHTDRLGTTRLLSDASGAGVDPTIYSAFGELESGTNHRFGYAGTSAYQAHDEFPYLHLGARYYDPTTGRFLQRDPTGVRGGLNVYEYAGGNPLTRIDPTGLGWAKGAARWAKNAAAAAKKWAEKAMGCSSAASAARGPIDVTTRALEGVPDLVRTKIAADFRRDTVLNPDLTPEEGLDAYFKGRDARVR